ncbi:hypothetical protein Dimus_022375 [Dionaea muscipula]
MAASSCQYTTDRLTVASASTSEDAITNILPLDSITQLSSQIEMLNKNFVNMGLVAAVNPSGTSQGAKQSEEENHVLANPESSTSRPPKKRKMKRSTSGKGVDAELESKKNAAPGTMEELDIPTIELPRPDLVSTYGKRNFVPTKEKVKDKEVPDRAHRSDAVAYPRAA